MASRAAANAAAAAGRYGKLWGRGCETFSPSERRVLSVRGEGATNYLQGLVTCDLLAEPRPPREEYDVDAVAKKAVEDGVGDASADATVEPVVPVAFTSRMRSACFLDNRGRILTDALLWKRLVGGASDPPKTGEGEEAEEDVVVGEAREVGGEPRASAPSRGSRPRPARRATQAACARPACGARGRQTARRRSAAAP